MSAKKICAPVGAHILSDLIKARRPGAYLQQAPPSQHSLPCAQQLGAAFSRGAAVAMPTTVRTTAASAAREIFVFIGLESS